MSGWIIKRGAREVPIPDESTLQKWADEGRFNPGDLIFHPVLQRWLYAKDVLEIGHAFTKPASQVTQPTETAQVSAPVAGPASQEFIIHQGNQEFRAPDLATLRSWSNERRVSPDSYIYHPALQRWILARDMSELGPQALASGPAVTKLASNYRQLVLWVGIQIIISIGLLLNLFPLFLGLALLASVLALAVYAARTAAALGSSAAPIWALAMLIPFINVITLLVLSSKATQVCRANGIPVGFLGPRVS